MIAYLVFGRICDELIEMGEYERWIEETALQYSAEMWDPFEPK